MPKVSALQELIDRLRDDIVTRYSLSEVGDPYEQLIVSPSGRPVGNVRVWTGPTIPKVIDTRLVVPELGIDSVMLHAFAPSHLAVPHLSSDVAGLGSRLNFVIDLTPRVDLTIEPAYLDAIYPPLTDARSNAYSIEGATPIDVPLRLLAFSSPWITAVNIDETKVAAIEPIYRAYIERFYAHIDSGVLNPSAADLTARDRAHRRAQFDPASDEVWDFLAGVVGQSSIDLILELVREPGPPRRR